MSPEPPPPAEQNASIEEFQRNPALAAAHLREVATTRDETQMVLALHQAAAVLEGMPPVEPPPPHNYDLGWTELITLWLFAAGFLGMIVFAAYQRQWEFFALGFLLLVFEVWATWTGLKLARSDGIKFPMRRHK